MRKINYGVKNMHMEHFETIFYELTRCTSIGCGVNAWEGIPHFGEVISSHHFTVIPTVHNVVHDAYAC